MSIVTLAIAVIMVVGIVAPVLLASAASSSDVNKLEQELADIEKKKKELQTNIKNANSQKKTEMQKKNQLDDEISLMQDEIDVLDRMIAQLDSDIAQKEGEEVQKQAEIDEQYERYKLRIRESYESGSTSYLEVLLSSDDFASFLTNLDIMEMIVQYDEDLIEELRHSKDEITEMKNSIEENKAKQETAKSSLVSKQKELEKKVAESDKLIEELANDAERFEEAYNEALKAEQKLDAELEKLLQELANSDYVGGDLIWPVPGKYGISCKYGPRTHPITKKPSNHTGIDIPAPKNHKIVAANAGTVVKVATNSAYGKYVLVDHGGGLATFYAHMNQQTVKEGQKVKAGEQIGKVGTTGLSTGNHCHFEVRVNGKTVDPVTYYKNTKWYYT
ncbi:murein hydrolase activator EnvC family protein [Feifania hominis]|uniref:Peptidoglycan DD-metalloendopeptidase family protein n=1 Tax=Feifania hominis TaxID=2763660 RepID=A0A926HPT2_9FIRM|nr:M23 family metallopeptidase [Feifania hominis]MBC8535592.1 peptidoglycan DD-metalloendopeptidase family protein [Feifania hominis]